ncbi:xylulokinase [Ramlibacter sp. MAHUQ-53]|uniref:xylulokinase n=1 Tax=unclassified Ramlibacter TaxID=2617605 RepID=UPI003627EEBD
MSNTHVLGLDLGTSGVKAVLLDEAGRLRAEATAPLQVQRPQAGWSEQDPSAWLAAADDAVRQLMRRADPADWRAVQALAVAGQMHGAVLLDAAGAVLRPAILWNDGRSQAQCEALERRVPEGRRIAANRAMAGFTAPKLLWVAEHEPELFARVAKVLLPKDWLAWQLSGEMGTDTSDASGTWWLDVAGRRWSETLLDATGLGTGHMPELHEGPDAIGWLRADWCQAWGLPARVRIAAGAGDNAAGALGVGAVQPGDGFVSLGTSGVLFVTTDGPRPNPARGVHSFCHALPGTWHQMAVLLSGAASLAWFAALTGAREADLLAPLTGAPRAEAPLFLPYLSGERTPHADPGARGSFINLQAGSTRDDLAHAVIEGVAFAFADGLDALAEAGPVPSQLLAIGGGARSDAWLQLLADVLQRPVLRAAGADVGPALGAARLAQLALGMDRAQVLRAPPTDRAFLPVADHQPVLAERLARFRRAYAPLRALAGQP